MIESLNDAEVTGIKFVPGGVSCVTFRVKLPAPTMVALMEFAVARRTFTLTITLDDTETPKEPPKQEETQ